MKNNVRKLFRLAGIFFCFFVLVICAYLFASIIGAAIPRQISSAFDTEMQVGGNEQAITSDPDKIKLFLIASLLHTDIALPVEDEVLETFPELLKTRLPFDNPRLKYLSFGWGSKAFYTTAGTYSDIRFGAVWKAVTGDKSVMRIVPLGDLEPSGSVIELSLSRLQFLALIEAIRSGFALDENDVAKALPQYSIGQGDVFFEGAGRFNLFTPCNQWTGMALNRGGLKTGIWTPTAYSLTWSLAWHN